MHQKKGWSEVGAGTWKQRQDVVPLADDGGKTRHLKTRVFGASVQTQTQ